jgi:hypothetical protein
VGWLLRGSRGTVLYVQYIKYAEILHICKKKKVNEKWPKSWNSWRSEMTERKGLRAEIVTGILLKS